MKEIEAAQRAKILFEFGRLKIMCDGEQWYCKWRVSETAQRYLLSARYGISKTGTRYVFWEWWQRRPICGPQMSVHPLEYW